MTPTQIMNKETPEIRKIIIKDGMILGLGMLSVLGLFFLGRWTHAQLHGACDCIPGLFLEYGPATLVMLLGLGALFSALMTRTRQRLQVQEDLQATNERMKNDLEAAAKIQKSLLPDSPPETSRVKLRWAFKPCAELAGDIFNVFPLGEHQLAIYMLDVSGHGVPAALLSVTLHRVLSPAPGRSSVVIAETKRQGCRPVPPAAVARQLNRQFPMDSGRRQYFTLLYGLLDLKTLEFRFTCAGHPAPAHLPPNGQGSILDVSGFPVGLLQEATYQEHRLALHNGDRLYLYSDGVTDAWNANGELFGRTRLLEVLQEGLNETLDDSLSLLMETLQSWCGGAPPADDISVLAIEVVK